MGEMMFELDERLKNDTHVVGEWPLSMLLLLDDCNFPWCILVPKREGIGDIYELDLGDQIRLLEESERLANALTEIFRPDKLNIAALGNVVRQLHIHHIARYVDDRAWPAPVWGAVPIKKYSDNVLKERIDALRRVLTETGLSWR